MISLTGIIKLCKDKENKEEEYFGADSLECGISAIGRFPQEAAENLAELLQGHIKDALAQKPPIIPFIRDSYGRNLEKLMRYCAENGMPEKLKEINIGHEMKLVCYYLNPVPEFAL